MENNSPLLELLITTEDGTVFECVPPMVQEKPETEGGEMPSPRPATEGDMVITLLQQTLAKAQPCGFKLASGGSIVLGPMAAARAKFLIIPIKDGPIAALPEPEPGQLHGDN